MSILTPFFNLIKPQKTDPTAIAQLNSNMDTIDTEMHRPPLTVNGIEPNSTTRDLQITTVPLADNLTTDEAQINTGTYVLRTSGGEASIADGSAWLSSLHGNQVKSGYVPESLEMSVTLADPTTEDPITASLDRETFIEEVTSSQTITLTYSNAWDTDPATYGITVTGTPVAGDKITVIYVKLNRGTITTATPTSFVSTGWNLYNHAAGYAHVIDYSSEYGFMIEGTYTALKFAETLSGEQTDITPVDGYFTLPAGASEGYVFVTGGNSTDTEIWMTWSDWTEEANGGTFAAYSQTTIDLSGVMVDFPDGLMRIGNYYDEINLNTQLAYSRVQKLEYTDENLAGVIASGVPYDTDTNYIYAVRVSPVTYSISLDGEYTASDHGMEMFVGTSVPVTASSLYGNDLKGKLRRDVLTISQQTLTAAQKTQVRSNISAASSALDHHTEIGHYSPTATLDEVKADLISVAAEMRANSETVRYICIDCKDSPFASGDRCYGYLYSYVHPSLALFSGFVKALTSNKTICFFYNSGTWGFNSIEDQLANKIQVRDVSATISLAPNGYGDVDGTLNSAFTNGANIYWIFNNYANLIFPICLRGWTDSTHPKLRLMNCSGQTLSDATVTYKIFGIKV